MRKKDYEHKTRKSMTGGSGTSPVLLFDYRKGKKNRETWKNWGCIMKNRKRKPFFWNIEEFAFGAVYLRDEIKRHKEADEEPWGIFKAIGIRLVYVYALTVALVMASVAIICQKIDQFTQQFKR